MEDVETLFYHLDQQLSSVDRDFFVDPKEFRPHYHVLEVLASDANLLRNPETLSVAIKNSPGYNHLSQSSKLVNDCLAEAAGRQGGLLQGLETLADAVREFSRARVEVRQLQTNLSDIKKTLIAKDNRQPPPQQQQQQQQNTAAQVALRDLYLQKVDLTERLRIARELEALKNAPVSQQRLLSQRKFLTASIALTHSLTSLFGESLASVGALVTVRESLMDCKSRLLDSCVTELRSAVLGPPPMFSEWDDEDFDDDASDTRSEAYTPTIASGMTSSTRQTSSSSGRSMGTSSVVQAMLSANNDTSGSISTGGANINARKQLFVFHTPSEEDGRAVWTIDLDDVDETLESQLASDADLAAMYAYGNTNTTYGAGLYGGNIGGALIGSSCLPTSITASAPITGYQAAFLKLLCKAVGKLSAEEDIERLLLESIGDGFYRTTITGLRSYATDYMFKLNNWYANNPQNMTDEDLITTHGKVFSEFAELLLNSLLEALQRLLYTLRLLSLSKKKNSTIGYSSHANSVKEEERKKYIFDIWQMMEESVLAELAPYLVDLEVQQITDQPTTSTGKNMNLRMNSDHEMTKDGMNKSSNESSLLSLFQPNEVSHLHCSGGLFLPSAKHGAVLFRKVSDYHARAVTIARENGLDAFFLASVDANLPPASGGTMKSHSGQRAAVVNVPKSTVLNRVQTFLERELIPVIQSTVNQEMRDVMTTLTLFLPYLPPPTALSGCSLAGNASASNLISTDLRGSGGMVPVATSQAARGQKVSSEWKPPSSASERVWVSASGLLRYWSQLNHHREMVGVVLDRCIRSAAAAARDVRDTYLFSWYVYGGPGMSLGEPTSSGFTGASAGEQLLKGAVKALSYDSNMAAFKQKAYYGRTTLEELFQVETTGRSTTSGGDSINALAIDRLLAPVYLNEVTTLWDSRFWDLSGASTGGRYVVSVEMATFSVESVRMATVIAIFGDWLTRRLSGAYKQLLRNTHANYSSAAMGSASAISAMSGGSNASKNRSLTALLIRGEQAETRAQLGKCLVGCLRDLIRTGDESLAALRASLQLITFRVVSESFYIPLSRDNALVKGIRISASSNNAAINPPTRPNASGSSNASYGDDAAVATLVAKLRGFIDTVSETADMVSPAVAGLIVPVVVGPLTTLVPRLLTRAIVQLVSALSPASTVARGRLLRIVVACHQQLSLFLREAIPADNEARKKLSDVLTEEFDRLRKFVSMIEMPAAEFKVYLRSHTNEFTREEVSLLWQRAIDKLSNDPSTADDLLRELSGFSSPVPGGLASPTYPFSTSQMNTTPQNHNYNSIPPIGLPPRPF